MQTDTVRPVIPSGTPAGYYVWSTYIHNSVPRAHAYSTVFHCMCNGRLNGTWRCTWPSSARVWGYITARYTKHNTHTSRYTRHDTRSAIHASRYIRITVHMSRCDTHVRIEGHRGRLAGCVTSSHHLKLATRGHTGTSQALLALLVELVMRVGVTSPSTPGKRVSEVSSARAGQTRVLWV